MCSIQLLVDAGATLLTGGVRYGTTGFFLQPTIFITPDVWPDVNAYDVDAACTCEDVADTMDKRSALKADDSYTEHFSDRHPGDCSEGYSERFSGMSRRCCGSLHCKRRAAWNAAVASVHDTAGPLLLLTRFGAADRRGSHAPMRVRDTSDVIDSTVSSHPPPPYGKF